MTNCAFEMGETRKERHDASPIAFELFVIVAGFWGCCSLEVFTPIRSIYTGWG